MSANASCVGTIRHNVARSSVQSKSSPSRINLQSKNSIAILATEKNTKQELSMYLGCLHSLRRLVFFRRRCQPIRELGQGAGLASLCVLVSCRQLEARQQCLLDVLEVRSSSHTYHMDNQVAPAPTVRHVLQPGFRRVKGKSASRLSSTDGVLHGAVAAAAAKEAESWEEFIHPLFRRGRRDLLVGIKRHKDGGRLKRKQGVTARNTHTEKRHSVLQTATCE